MVNWNAEMDQRLLIAGIHLGGDWTKVTKKWQELYGKAKIRRLDQPIGGVIHRLIPAGNDPNVQQPTHQATMKHIERLKKGLGVSSGRATSRPSPAKKAELKGASSSAESSDQSEEVSAVKNESKQVSGAKGTSRSRRAQGNISKKRKVRDISEDEESDENQEWVPSM